MILEPVVQGAGGMRFYSPEYVCAARELANRYETLLILDEIATGFGRTGHMFACEKARISPDIMCVGKALTGGYMSLAATLSTAEVSEVISGGRSRRLYAWSHIHGKSSCLCRGRSKYPIAAFRPMEGKGGPYGRTAFGRAFSLCRNLPGVVDVRVLGAIGVVELVRPVNIGVLQEKFVEKGVWLRPFGQADLYHAPLYH